MKNSFKTLILSCFVVAVSLLFIGCGQKIKRIELTDEICVEYYVGESLDLQNAKLKVVYDNGTDFIEITEDMISGFNTSTAGEFELQISYKNKSIIVSYVVNERTFAVNITLNNANYGELINDNVKQEYNYNDIINISIAPKEGYYLRGYSDCDDKTLAREIVVTQNMNIEIELAKGEGFNFYGYNIATSNEIDEKTFSRQEGNIGTFLKLEPNSINTTGSLHLRVPDYLNRVSNSLGFSDLSCWVFTNSKTGVKKIYTSSALTSFGESLLSQQDLEGLLGETGNEWIDVEIYKTNVGYAYYVYSLADNLPDECYTKIGNINVENFYTEHLNNFKFVYFKDNEISSGGFDYDNNKTYSSNVSAGSTIFIQPFRLFEVDEILYYYTNSDVNYFISGGESKSFTIEINEIEYDVVISHVSGD